MPHEVQIETQSKQQSLAHVHAGSERPGARAESLCLTEGKRLSIRARRW
jgi:hypothetical protein